VKRLVTIVALAILPVGLVLFDLSDTHISVADTGTPNGGVNSSMSKLIKKRGFRAERKARDQGNAKAILKGYFD
jgi:hypothetical protein